MLADIADAFGCFVLATIVLGFIGFHLTVICDETAPAAVIAYITAANLVGWYGNCKSFLKYSFPLWSGVLIGGYLLGLRYSIVLLVVVLILSVVIMNLTRMFSPAVKDL